MYGKISLIMYDGMGVFKGLFFLFEVMCYYSFVIELESLLVMFKVNVWIVDGEIMGVYYVECLVYGV